MASISLHFVTLLKGTGDVGALNPKDANKGTVLALLAIFCAILAGGSKASISLHFATPLKGMGDVGDLNAQDTSKKIVLAFLGIMHTYLGHCTIGSSFSEILSGPIPLRLLKLFKNEQYLLWFDRLCLLRQESPSVEGFLRLHICLKDRYNTEDQLKAWIHAAELCRVISARRNVSGIIDALEIPIRKLWN